MLQKQIIFLFLSLIVAQQLHGQQRKEIVTIEQILTDLVTKINVDSIYRVENIVIEENQDDGFSSFEFLSNHFPEIEKIDGRITIHQRLVFKNCVLPSYFSLEGLHFKKGIDFVESSQISDGYIQLDNICSESIFTFFNNNVGGLVLTNSVLKSEVIFQFNKIGEFYIEDNEFQGLVSSELNETSRAISFLNNIFNPQNEINLIFNDWYKGSEQVRTSLQINNHHVPELVLEGNKFESSLEYNLVSLVGPIDHLSIRENEISGILELDCRISGSLELTSNSIQFIDLTRMGFSETHNLITFNGNQPKLVKVITLGEPYLSQDNSILWDSDRAALDTTRVNSIDELQTPFDIYSVDHISSESFDQYYSELIRAYYHLQNAFHANGDVHNTNIWYVKMKEHEALWLKRELGSSGSFSILIRWFLNRLMKAYTEHGTDPGKAMLVSIWIIMGFAFVYLFFPSEWEKEGKSNMILNYSEFIKKNDKGYVRPFLSLFSNVIISYINALTLSLNSFVTLGFGRIPTAGIARYICVLEGFVGWFLLSLFTVALINQVLF